MGSEVVNVDQQAVRMSLSSCESQQGCLPCAPTSHFLWFPELCDTEQELREVWIFDPQLVGRVFLRGPQVFGVCGSTGSRKAA